MEPLLRLICRQRNFTQLSISMSRKLQICHFWVNLFFIIVVIYIGDKKLQILSPSLLQAYLVKMKRNVDYNNWDLKDFDAFFSFCIYLLYSFDPLITLFKIPDAEVFSKQEWFVALIIAVIFEDYIHATAWNWNIQSNVNNSSLASL